MKYALFEFTEDDSVEVGDVSCIQDIDKYEKDLNDVVNKNVMVKWPTSTSGTKFGSYEATVVAVNGEQMYSLGQGINCTTMLFVILCYL